MVDGAAVRGGGVPLEVLIGIRVVRVDGAELARVVVRVVAEDAVLGDGELLAEV